MKYITFRREFFIVDVVRLDQALDGRQLVLRIEDLERLRQRGVAVMGAAGGYRPWKVPIHMPRVLIGSMADRREHFLGGLVGKGHGQDAGRRYLSGLDQPGDAGGQHAGLAGAGPARIRAFCGGSVTAASCSSLRL
jgi:hypothetical protein